MAQTQEKLEKYPVDVLDAKLVSIQPGLSTLTRTSGASARARLLLKASTPPLTAENSCGSSPAIPVVTSFAGSC